jgi:hypothetical protein
VLNQAFQESFSYATFQIFFFYTSKNS